MRQLSGSVFAVVLGVAAGAGPGVPEAAPCAAGKLTGAPALSSDWSDDRPGLCREILPGDLPPSSPSNSNFRTVVRQPAGVLPQVPPGFAVRKFYQGATEA